MDHWCHRPSAFSNISVTAWKELDIPRHPNGSYSHCTVRALPDGGAWDRVEPCVEWEFDLDEHGNTAVSEWSVVCQRRHLADGAQAVHLVATTITFLALGPIADRIGRKVVLVLALAALLLMLAATGVATDLQTLIIVRSVAAASSAGLFVRRVLLYEITTTTRRLLYTTIGSALSFVIARKSPSFAHVLNASWSVWHMLLA
nr:solute carrier family 22 member 7-like [Dermacentor andersoni]